MKRLVETLTFSVLLVAVVVAPGAAVALRERASRVVSPAGQQTSGVEETEFWANSLGR